MRLERDPFLLPLSDAANNSGLTIPQLRRLITKHDIRKYRAPRPNGQSGTPIVLVDIREVWEKKAASS